MKIIVCDNCQADREVLINLLRNYEKKVEKPSKHVVEFDVVWILYLFLKAKNEGKEVEYINLSPDKSMQGIEVLG